MTNWFLRLFENTSINEVWVALSLNSLIAIGILVVISSALAKRNFTKRNIFSCSIIGAFTCTIWVIITAQFLLSLCQDVVTGTEQDNWIFVLRLFGLSKSLFSELLYSNIMESMYRFTPKSFPFYFLPSYVLAFIFGFLGCFSAAVSLPSAPNKDKILSRMLMAIPSLVGFVFIFTGFSISVFYQAMILAGG